MGLKYRNEPRWKPGLRWRPSVPAATRVRNTKAKHLKKVLRPSCSKNQSLPSWNNPMKKSNWIFVILQKWLQSQSTECPSLLLAEYFSWLVKFSGSSTRSKLSTWTRGTTKLPSISRYVSDRFSKLVFDILFPPVISWTLSTPYRRWWMGTLSRTRAVLLWPTWFRSMAERGRIRFGSNLTLNLSQLNWKGIILLSTHLVFWSCTLKTWKLVVRSTSGCSSTWDPCMPLSASAWLVGPYNDSFEDFW